MVAKLARPKASVHTSVHACCVEEERCIGEAHIPSFMTLLRGIDRLTTSLAEEITMEFDRTA
jgi:hypothetical protein